MIHENITLIVIVLGLLLFLFLQTVVHYIVSYREHREFIKKLKQMELTHHFKRERIIKAVLIASLPLLLKILKDVKDKSNTIE